MSFFWILLFRVPPPWEGGCIEHDRAYWRGGPLHLRLEADSMLMQYVAAKGHPYWAWLMFLAVRIGGVWWFPFPSARLVGAELIGGKLIGGHWVFVWDGVRWGYGFYFPRYK